MTVTPLNGNTHIRERSTESATVLPCGCAHNDTVWLQMCTEHLAECRAHHLASVRRSELEWLQTT